MPPTLDDRIENLSDQVDDTIRTELQAHLRSLRRDGNPIGALLGMSRLSLLLVRKVFAAIDEKVPSDNLYNCLVRLSAGDPDLRITGLKLLPKEVDTRTHAVRVLSNMVDHAKESAPPTVSDAEDALSLFLRLLRWYYVEFERGPRLASIEQPRRRRSRAAVLWMSAITVLCLLVGVGIWLDSLRQPTGLAGLLEEGPKTVAAGPPPRLSLDLLRWDNVDKRFRQLADGDTLRTEIDAYAIVARPGTAGHLYIFQIDSQGHVNWYYPKNHDKESFGENPVIAGLPVCVPPADSKRGLELDDHIGRESVFAVLTTERWPALEEYLGQKVESQSKVVVAVVGRGSKGSKLLETTTEIKLSGSTVHLVSREHEANGAFIQVVRWFEHK